MTEQPRLTGPSAQAQSLIFGANSIWQGSERLPRSLPEPPPPRRSLPQIKPLPIGNTGTLNLIRQGLHEDYAPSWLHQHQAQREWWRTTFCAPRYRSRLRQQSPPISSEWSFELHAPQVQHDEVRWLMVALNAPASRISCERIIKRVLLGEFFSDAVGELATALGSRTRMKIALCPDLQGLAFRHRGYIAIQAKTENDFGPLNHCSPAMLDELSWWLRAAR